MRRQAFLAGCFALFLAGCGSDGPQLCEVVGTVTLDGAPIEGVELTFVPQNVPATMLSYGRTDAAGRYELAFTAAKTGAIPATHHVRVDIPGGKSMAKINKKYQPEGTITKEVKDGHNVIDIELSSP
ncbi:hypothetical protein Pan44_11950 [Caulifigura coniformis]|uniref:Carboxypeptidase regulatory-like domain-containing protein n=1 Tax=Caulifigura coniformis TaxID=2527983 RepID=A0A517SAN2_9PLAN|nr:hypothetical protein [Caulifigura coniformis]QDT53179.1 hypothetical protein Pan44_11950 [Caulifigura coniformis]